jgi:DNA-binding transcriptional ArsR family regulator
MSFQPEAAERFLKVLGDVSRLRILEAIGDSERSVSEVMERTGLAQTLVSFHLRTLREAGVLATERRGPFIYYRLTDPSLLNLLEACAKYSAKLIDGKGITHFQWPPWGMMCRMMGGRRK